MQGVISGFQTWFSKGFFSLKSDTVKKKKKKKYFAPLNKYMQDKYVDQPRWQSASAC